MANVGLRIYSTIKRPSRDMVQQFAGLPVANIADMMNRMFCVNARIRPMNAAPLLGPAFTVKCRPGDNLLLHKALDMAEPGDILVVDAQGDMSNSIMGELMVLWAMKRKLGGFVVDGAIRDIGSIRNLDIPVYAAGITPAGPYKDGPGEINVPVVCGGVVVNPGDILVGDEDGIVVVCPEDAPELIKKTKAKNLAEQQTMKEIENMAWDRAWVDKALKERACEVID